MEVVGCVMDSDKEDKIEVIKIIYRLVAGWHGSVFAAMLILRHYDMAAKTLPCHPSTDGGLVGKVCERRYLRTLGI